MVDRPPGALRMGIASGPDVGRPQPRGTRGDGHHETNSDRAVRCGVGWRGDGYGAGPGADRLEGRRGGGEDHAGRADLDGRLRRPQETVGGRGGGPVRQGPGDRRPGGNAAGHRHAGPDQRATHAARLARNRRARQVRPETRVAADELLAHALRSGTARVATGGRRGQGRARSGRGTLRGRFAAEAGRAGRRRHPASGTGAAGFPARPCRVCHEPPPPDAERVQQRAEFRGPGGPRGARAPGDRSAREADGCVVRLRLPQHDHGRLPDPRRLCRLCPAVPGRRAPGHDGLVHDRLRRRPEPVSARQRGTGQVPWPHAGPGRRGRAADSAPAAARSALPGV